MTMLNSGPSFRTREIHNAYSSSRTNSLVSAQIQPNSQQRKARNAMEILKTPHNSHETYRHQDLKQKYATDVQQSDGCFVLLESAHFNPIIPCIPAHLGSRGV